MSKGLYQLEVIKDHKDSGLKKGDIVWVYGVYWMIDIIGMDNALAQAKKEGNVDLFKDSNYTDMSFFKVWIDGDNQGWYWIQDCYLKPINAKLNRAGIC